MEAQGTQPADKDLSPLSSCPSWPGFGRVVPPFVHGIGKTILCPENLWNVMTIMMTIATITAFDIICAIMGNAILMMVVACVMIRSALKRSSIRPSGTPIRNGWHPPRQLPGRRSCRSPRPTSACVAIL